MSGAYKFKGRADHSAPVIGDSLYLWGGDQPNLLRVHDSHQKRELTSSVETFTFSSARWSSHLTRGTPPLGVMGYSCTTFQSNIYYYAGACGDYYNSLNVLNTLTMSWTQLHPNDESMMKKAFAGMLSLELDGTDYLFMVGGIGPTPPVKHPQFRYEQFKDGRVITNEQLLYNLSDRQFTVPSVSGQCCRPNSQFSINKINPNKAIMFGGIATHDDLNVIPTNDVYIFHVTHNTIHWESIKKGSISGEGLWPVERAYHASAIINDSPTSPTLVVIGGVDNNYQLINECLLFTTGQYSCKKIPLPESVTGRYSHSLTAVTMSPNCVWLVIVGGYEGYMRMLQNHAPITDTNRLVMIVELVYSEAGEWIVQSVLDSNDLTSKKYQEKYSSYSKTRTWWMDQLIKYPTEKETELQRYIQLLQDRVRVLCQDKVSLQEALVEANEQSSKRNGNELAIMNEKFEAEKQIITEDNEKLKAKVDDYEVYITEIKEKKKQVEEEKRKVQEQYHQEKQLTKELKTKAADSELYTAKLMKEKEQLQERVTSLEEQSIKETSTKEVQFDYMIPSMDNLKCLSDVEVAEKKLFLIQGDKPQQMNWEKYGLRIGVQEGSLLSSETVEAAVVALVGGQFEFPPNTVLVSAVYAVSLSKPLLKRLKLEIQHCVDLTGRPDLAQYLKFAIAPVSTPSLPYNFAIVEGGEFSFNSGYGSIQRNKFCLVCILGEEWTNKENEDQEEEQDEEGEGEGSDSDDDTSSTPPEVSGACKESTTKETNLPTNTVSVAGPTTPNTDHVNEVPSTGIKKAIAYAGLVYYEEKGVEDLVTFTAAKNLEALIHYIERKHSQAEIGPDIPFCFKLSNNYVELDFDAPQKKPFTGWTLNPHTDPCRLYQEAIDKFGDKEHSRPSCCLISVYGSPDAVPLLNYFIPLEGVAHPVSLNIHRARRNLTVPVPPSAEPTTSSSDTITEATAVSSTGGASAPATVDVKKVKKAINDAIVSHYDNLTSLPKDAVSDLANKLYAVRLISEKVRDTCSMEGFISEFKASLNFKRKLSEVQDHCQNFLSSFIAVRGSCADAAKALREDWIEAIRNELGFDFVINIDT